MQVLLVLDHHGRVVVVEDAGPPRSRPGPHHRQLVSSSMARRMIDLRCGLLLICLMRSWQRRHMLLHQTDRVVVERVRRHLDSVLIEILH